MQRFEYNLTATKAEGVSRASCDTVPRVPRVVRQWQHDPYAPLELIDVPPRVPQAVDAPYCWCAACVGHAVAAYNPYHTAHYATTYVAVHPEQQPAAECYQAEVADAQTDGQQRLQLEYRNGRPVLRDPYPPHANVYITQDLSQQDISFEAHTEQQVRTEDSQLCEEEEDAAITVAVERGCEAPAGLLEEPQSAAEQTVSWDPNGVLVRVEFRWGTAVFVSKEAVQEGDHVIVDADRGMDLGIVVAIDGDGVRLRLPRKRTDKDTPEVMYVRRHATASEVQEWTDDLVHEERAAVQRARTLARRFGLHMDILRAKYQFDRNKLSLEFEADDKVMFVPLAKALHAQYRCRIWLQQVNFRRSSVDE